MDLDRLIGIEVREMRILTVNSGSATLKLSVIDRDGGRTTARTIEGPSDDDAEVLAEFLVRVGPVDAVGHRVVHGGPRYTAPVEIDADVIQYLESIGRLAPSHQSRAIAAIRAVMDIRPGVPSVAVFDTAFHASLRPAARTYALPREWNERLQLRRYGFHGLSHARATRRGAQLTGMPLDGARIISCHLGSGASLAAVVDGRSVDTTMGFTPLEGLVMATRSGSIDPGLLLWLLTDSGLTVNELADVLEHGSGLCGLSGTSGDMREVLAARAGGDPDATLAFDVYIHQLVRAIGAMTACAGGLDLLVFTGGVGENAAPVRSAVGAALGYLGVEIDETRNLAATGDTEISASEAAVRTVVISAAEDLEIAAETETTLRRRS